MWKKCKKWIKLIFIIVWLVVIFMFSSQNSKESLDLSKSFVVKVVTIIKQRELTYEEKTRIVKKYIYYIRKFAHFFLYFVLGFLIYIMLYDFFDNKYKLIYYTVMLCALYACFDEIHQYFVEGRTSQILDVCVDTCGALVSCSIIHVFTNMVIFVKNKLKKK